MGKGEAPLTVLTIGIVCTELDDEEIHLAVQLDVFRPDLLSGAVVALRAALAELEGRARTHSEPPPRCVD